MAGELDRVFVAVPLPMEVRMALADRLDRLAIPGAVVPPENWHITLRFLGWIGPVAYDRLLAELDTADRGPCFDIALGGLGAFPRAGKATVLWLAVVKGEKELEGLAGLAEEAAQAAGLDPEERPFRSHLTLSRIRPPQDVAGLVEGHPEVGIEWRCEAIVVYRSRLGRGGARYEPLETFPLSR